MGGPARPGCRLITPIRIAGDVNRPIVFEPDNGRWKSTGSQLCTFMPLRGGASTDPRRILPLGSDGAVVFQTNQDQNVDPEQVCEVLSEPFTTTKRSSPSPFTSHPSSNSPTRNDL